MKPNYAAWVRCSWIHDYLLLLVQGGFCGLWIVRWRWFEIDALRASRLSFISQFLKPKDVLLT
ncbi:hypothetical protein TBK1r_39170 [Stieleria magnilauensis]|uniref:Uncharacterized protein n=1 Tax=Stieleria magnilauensis TaxID=2527963 RepID=A0ABX5XU85_9BACT|nr:hypothetical protein TBK1r_39170 [Planctomycetes bacterium TBK1r]